MSDRQKTNSGEHRYAHGGILPATVKIPPGKGKTFLVLSETLLGVWTHWVGQRSRPCNSAVQGECLVDHRTAGGRRWQGWLAVQLVAKGEPAFLGITEGCLRGCPELRRPRTLRGTTLHAWRIGDEKQSKLACRIVDSGMPSKELWQAPSAAQFLCRLWDVPFEGNLPAGVEGYPAEQGTLAFQPPPVDLEESLRGTIWEGKANLLAMPRESVQSVPDFVNALRQRGAKQ